MNTAFINRIATAVPPHDVHRPFVEFAESMLPEGVKRSLFRRMARVAAIEHRYSFIQPIDGNGAGWHDAESLYVRGSFPSTARRMQIFEKFAPRLAEAALDRLALSAAERAAITHVNGERSERLGVQHVGKLLDSHSGIIAKLPAAA